MFELAFSSFSEPLCALSIRFPMFSGLRAGRNMFLLYFVAFLPWAGNLKGGDIRTLIPDTVSFIPYTIYLLLDT